MPPRAAPATGARGRGLPPMPPRRGAGAAEGTAALVPARRLALTLALALVMAPAALGARVERLGEPVLTCGECRGVAELLVAQLRAAGVRTAEELMEEHTGRRRRLMHPHSELDITDAVTTACAERAGEGSEAAHLGTACSGLVAAYGVALEDFVFAHGVDDVPDALCTRLARVCPAPHGDEL